MQQTIAVVHDDPAIVALVRAILENEGYAAVGCHDVFDALRCIREAHADLVVLDIEMQAIDGVALYDDVRNDRTTRGLPVILLAPVADDVTQRLSEDGVQRTATLLKPFAIDTLIGLVRMLLAPGASMRYA